MPRAARRFKPGPARRHPTGVPDPLPSDLVQPDDVRVWRTPAIQVEQVDVPAGVRLRGHGHDEPHLCFLSRGAFDERDRGAGHRFAVEGTLRGSPAGDEHDLTFRAPSRCMLVLFAGGSIEPAILAERRWVVDTDAQRRAADLAGLLQDTAASPLEIELIALELMARASPHARQPRPGTWLNRIRERIADAPHAAPTTRELAMETGLHPVYVARAFRAAFGTGIGEYARLMRAEMARRLLADGALPLAELALRAGYADQSHLTREMRRFLGATPASVRRGAARIRQVAGVQDDGTIARIS